MIYFCTFLGIFFCSILYLTKESAADATPPEFSVLFSISYLPPIQKNHGADLSGVTICFHFFHIKSAFSSGFDHIFLLRYNHGRQLQNYHSLNCRADVIPIAGTGGSQTNNSCGIRHRLYKIQPLSFTGIVPDSSYFFFLFFFHYVMRKSRHPEDVCFFMFSYSVVR